MRIEEALNQNRKKVAATSELLENRPLTHTGCGHSKVETVFLALTTMAQHPPLWIVSRYYISRIFKGQKNVRRIHFFPQQKNLDSCTHKFHAVAAKISASSIENSKKIYSKLLLLLLLFLFFSSFSNTH